MFHHNSSFKILNRARLNTIREKSTTRPAECIYEVQRSQRLWFEKQAVALSPVSRKKIWSQISIQVSITHRWSHVRRWCGYDGSSTWPGYCPVAAEECCEGSALWEQESERDSDTACDSEAGLVCNSAKLTGGDDLQTWSRIPESCFTRNGCYCCNRKKNAFLYTRTGFSGTDHILN